MAEFYTNLPPKEKDQLQKTVEKLTTTNYQTDYEFNVGEYDSTIAFFVKRNFSRVAAESTAYAILSQAKIDNIKPQQILDQLKNQYCVMSPPIFVRIFIGCHLIHWQVPNILGPVQHSNLCLMDAIGLFCRLRWKSQQLYNLRDL